MKSTTCGQRSSDMIDAARALNPTADEKTWQNQRREGWTILSNCCAMHVAVRAAKVILQNPANLGLGVNHTSDGREKNQESDREAKRASERKGAREAKAERARKRDSRSVRDKQTRGPSRKHGRWGGGPSS